MPKLSSGKSALEVLGAKMRRMAIPPCLLLGVSFAPTAVAAAAPSEAQTRVVAASGPATVPNWAERGAAARVSFLQVERFARLPADEQAKGLGAFYRDVVPKTLNGTSVMILSSYPTDILNRQKTGMPGGNVEDLWAGQMQDAVPQMTPEQMADNLQSSMWLSIGSYVRTKQLLKAQEKPLLALVAADLDSPDVVAFKRGCQMVQELKLTQFTAKLLDVYIPDGPRAEAAYTALVLLGDHSFVDRLKTEVLKDPKTIVRHAGLFQGSLSGHKVDPDILKLLSSPDADVRYSAAYALMECKDDALAKPLAALAKDETTRTQALALIMAIKLSDDAFKTIRADLLGALKSKEPAVKNAATKAFTAHKDLAAASALREYLTAPKPPSNIPGLFNFSMQPDDLRTALRTLTGSDFGYNVHDWGSPNNAAAVGKFDEWVLQHGGTIEINNMP